VQKFTPDGRYLGQFGGFGSGAGQFNLPWGIGLDKDGNVYVADWRNDRIQRFTPDGGWLATFGRSGGGVFAGS
jgi:DNA-binding beta-propeller fold protein YncE